MVTVHGETLSTCGYCKTSRKSDTEVGSLVSNIEESSISFGVVSDRMLVTDYEDLMLIGWRRSGNYFYKPNMLRTCCPQYTIRLKVDSYRPSKSQRHVVKKFKSYLENDHDENTTNESAASDTVASTVPFASLEAFKEAFDHPPKHTFTITTENSFFTEEKYELYRSYQINVHGDDPMSVTKESFTRFLVTSPLVNNVESSATHSDPTTSYGTFHQLYRVDGRLVGVGVIDILPSGLSSVYFFYDPAFRRVSLGKYSAMKEIEYCRNRNVSFYYMGFYVHTCNKMNYKGEFAPSELLCPTTFRWFPLKDVVKSLDCGHFMPLDPQLADEWLQLHPSARSDYNAMNARFGPQVHVPEDFSINNIPFFIGSRNQRIYLHQLTEFGKEFVTSKVKEMMAICGVEIFNQFQLQFF